MLHLLVNVFYLRNFLLALFNQRLATAMVGGMIAGIGAILSNFPSLQKLQWIATDDLDLEDVPEWTPAPAPAAARGSRCRAR